MHQTEQLRLEVAASLAGNPDLVISSSSNDEVNAMMMCDAVLNNVKPGQPVNRSQVGVYGHGSIGICLCVFAQCVPAWFFLNHQRKHFVMWILTVTLNEGFSRFFFPGLSTYLAFLLFLSNRVGCRHASTIIERCPSRKFALCFGYTTFPGTTNDSIKICCSSIPRPGRPFSQESPPNCEL